MIKYSNIPNLLTFSRLILIPSIIIIIYFDRPYSGWLSCLVFIAAAITDYLDGKLARKWNSTSKIGALLDPIADKILLCSTLLAIVLITNDYFIGLMGVMILVREFWVSGLREYTAQNHVQSASDVSFLAKIKTTLQFIAIGSYLFSFNYGASLGIFISSFILFLSMLVSLKTGMTYTSTALKLK